MKNILTLFTLFCTTMLFGNKVIVNDNLPNEFGKPIPFSKIAGTKGTMDLQISNEKLYALENQGLSIYDLSDKLSPKLIGRIDRMGIVRQIRIVGNTAFLSARESGLWAVDISDAKNPKIVSNFATIELATGLDVVGDLAVLGVRVFGVQCVDVSNPTKMKHISSIITNESQSVVYRDGLIFSGDWGRGEITVIDASDLANLKTITKFQLDGYGDGLEIHGNYLYASTGHHKKSGPKAKRHAQGHALEIFDISNLKKPKRLSRTQFPPAYFRYADYWTPRVCGNYVFAVDTINGMFVVDISDKLAPKIVGNIVLPKVAPDDASLYFNFPEILNKNTPYGDPLTSVAVGDGVVYFSGLTTGIYMTQLPDIAKPQKSEAIGALPKIPNQVNLSQKGFISSGEERLNPIRAAAVSGDIAYAANVYGGVKIFKLSDDKIEHIDTIKVPCAYDVSVSEGRLLVAQGLSGSGIYEISNFPKIEYLGTIKDSSEMSRYVRVFDGTNIVAVYGGGIVKFYDITNPQSPQLVLSEKVEHILYNDFGSRKLVSGKYWNLNCHSRGCWIFEISKNSVRLVEKEYTQVNSQTGGTCAFGSKFLMSLKGGYGFLNPKNPLSLATAQPKMFEKIDEIEAEDFGGKKRYEGLMDFDGKKRVAVSNRICKNCRVYDFSDENAPKLLNSYLLTTNPDMPTFWRGKLLLPCGYAGLLLEK